MNLTDLPWRKSSYSGTETACVELAVLPWRKSSYSGSESNCVELADGGALVFPRPALDTLISSLHAH